MLAIVGAALVIGLAAGLLAGGKFSRMSEVHFSGTPLAFGALAVMIVVPLVDLGDPADRILIASAYALVAAFLVVNIARRKGAALRVGLAVIALGWTLNATVMVVNGGMPLSPVAYAASGQVDEPTPGRGGFFKIVLADENTRLRVLGDVIALRPLHRVASLGDLVLMLGLAVTISAGMRGGAARPSRLAMADSAGPALHVTQQRRRTPLEPGASRTGRRPGRGPAGRPGSVSPISSKGWASDPAGSARARARAVCGGTG